MGGARTDIELLEASRTGDRAAFGTLVERYQSLICAVSYSATGDRALSEDVAQDTFIAAWSQLDQVRKPNSLRSWLCGIARNLGRKARRRTGREAPLDDTGQLASSTASPFERTAGAESERIVWDALRRIPESSREALVLYYREARSVREVAEALGISENAAMQRLSRGRKQLSDAVARVVESSLERSRPRRGFAAAVIAGLPGADPLPHVPDTAHGPTARTTPTHGGSSMFKGILVATALAAAGTSAYFLYPGTDAADAASTPATTVSPADSTPPAVASARSMTVAALRRLAAVREEVANTPPMRSLAVEADCPADAECDVAVECEPAPGEAPRLTAARIAELGLHDGPARGPAGAPVTIVVFGDFSCHLCGVVLGTIDELWDDYPGKLRLIVKPFAVLEEGALAARAALAADAQGRFWPMHDLMYANQDDLSEAALLRYAAEAGLDVDRFRADLDAGRFAAEVRAILGVAEEIGIRGTPSFLINGKLFVGARPIDQFRAAIDAEL